MFHLGGITTKICVLLAKERTKKFESFFDGVTMIIANGQFLRFCYKRKDMLLENIPIKKQWALIGVMSFNTD